MPHPLAATNVNAHAHDDAHNHKDSRRPIFHPGAPRGWSSDPSGPVAFKGRFHLFHQHLATSAQWYWGICWAHQVSDDLVHWRNLPPAVVPTPGGLDADGCFSGTVELDHELGVPVIIYTGVYLKTNAEAVAAHGLPPPEHDPGTRFVERQLLAVPADPDDPDLTYWVKLPAPAISLPPAGLNISCWRDPFCLTRPAAAGGEGDEWIILLASGIRGVGGAVLRFRSKHFTHGWRFDGILAQGDNAALGIKGQDWECPILTQLPTTTRAVALAALSSSKPHALPSGSRSDASVASNAPGTPAASSRLRRPISMSSLSNLGGSSASLAALASDSTAGQLSNSSSGSSARLAAAADETTGPASSSTASASGSAAAVAAAALAAAVSSSNGTTHYPAGSSLHAWVEQQTQQLQDRVEAAATAAPTVATSSSDSTRPWWFCMSPDACNNPITYWLGSYEGGRFDVAAADGPHYLDRGKTLYAATLSQDKGRWLLYGWIQEHRRVPMPPALVDAFCYAGSISTPRVLQLVEGRLWQTPLPEIDTLRTSTSWHQRDLLLDPAAPLLPLHVVSGTHLDINVTMQPPVTTSGAASLAAPAASQHPQPACSTSTSGQDNDSGPRAGLVFQSWREGGRGAAVLAFHWASSQLLFEFDEPFPDAYNPHPDDTPARRRVGGRLTNYVPGEPLSLRVLLDGSAVEVFTTGETLTTRMYRGHPPACVCAGCSSPAAGADAVDATSLSAPQAAAAAAGADDDDDTGGAGIALFAAGAPVLVSELDVWEMGSCWVSSSQDAGSAPPLPPAVVQQQQHLAALQQDEHAGAARSGVAESPSTTSLGGSSSSSSDSSAGINMDSGAGNLHDAAVAAAEAAHAAAEASGHAAAAAGVQQQPDEARADGTQPEGEADVDAEQAPCCRETFLQQLHIHP